jgi:hypothetical protein
VHHHLDQKTERYHLGCTTGKVPKGRYLTQVPVRRTLTTIKPDNRKDHQVPTASMHRYRNSPSGSDNDEGEREEGAMQAYVGGQVWIRRQKPGPID